MSEAEGVMRIDVRQTPFSAYGSYLAVRLADDGHSLIIRDVQELDVQRLVLGPLL